MRIRTAPFVLSPLVLAMTLAACGPAAEPAAVDPVEAAVPDTDQAPAPSGDATTAATAETAAVSDEATSAPPARPGARPDRGGPGRDGPQTLATMQARMSAAFDRLDADNDGAVTTAELEAGANQGGRGGRQLVRADANDDGRITREEVRAMAAQMFGFMDANGDGTITPDERPMRGPGGPGGPRPD